MKSILIVCLFFAVAHCSEVGFGDCPNFPTQANFKAAEYLGVWYEYSKYSQIFQTGTCSSANYSLNDDGSVRVVNQEKEANGELYTLEGRATFTNGSDVAKLTVQFPVQPVPAPYWVLSTDYTNFAVVFSCSDLLNLLNVQSVWLLTRERQPSEEVVNKALDVLTQNKLSPKPLIKTPQENC